MPVGTPIGRSANPMNMGAGAANVPGGLSIGSSNNNKDEGENEDGDGDQGDEQRNNSGGNASGNSRKRRRASSSAGNNASSPTTRAAAAANQAAQAQNNNSAPVSAPPAPQPGSGTQGGQGGPTTSPHARTSMPLPIPQQGGPVPISPTGGLTSPLDHQQQQHRPQAAPTYGHQPYPGGDMYPGSGAPPGGYAPGGPPAGAPYHPVPTYDPSGVPGGAPGGQPGGMPPPAWGPNPGAVPQYGRR
ncbi:hypothetical protein K474DRAFT_1258981 [Panus rudis PR-1116 ss-1]|nr:hypothetical protein K474DRAFT_1258981 [Panus rudis PR-1116 ss-1]